MRKFDTRSVLDRLDTTFKSLFNTHWKMNLSPFLIILVINIIGWVISAILVPLVLFLASFSLSSTIEKIVIVSILGTIFIFWVTLFYWITGNLATITTYLVMRKQGTNFQAMDILREAKSYIPSALKFDGYYYSVFALVVFILFLVLFPSIQGDMSQIFWMLSTQPDYQALGKMILQFLSITILVGGIFFGFSIWFSTRYAPAKPGFVLEQKGELRDFMEWQRITNGNFWNILGNMMVLSLVLSVVIWLWNSFFGGFFSSTPSLNTGWSTPENMDDVIKYLPNILSMIAPWPIGGSMIVWLIINTLAGIFRNGFSYTLYQELSTVVDTHVIIQDSEREGIQSL